MSKLITKTSIKTYLYLTVILLITVASSSSLRANQEMGAKSLYDEVTNAIDVYIENLKSISSTLDQSKFNTEELVLKLELDDSQVVNFVENKIHFEQYPGLLRGVSGTLQNRAGNSLDQSLLLASLLNSSGFEARILTGELNQADSIRLIKQISARPTKEMFGDADATQKKLAEYGIEASQGSMDWKDTETWRETKKSTQYLLKELARHNIKFKSEKLEARLADEARQYFWVEYRMASGEPWKSSHPSFGADKVVPSVKVEKYFKGSMPDSYFHKLRVEAFIEQRTGNTIKISKIMKAWERPVANLNGFAISYVNLPNALNLKNIDDLQKIVETTTFFNPTFNGKSAGDEVFDLKGRLVDIEAMASGKAGVFQSLANNSDNASAAFSSSKDSQSNFELISHWLEFTLIAPGGAEKKFRRYILAPSDKKLDLNKLKLQLMTEHTFMVNSGGQSIDYVAERYLTQLTERHELLKALLHHFMFPEEKTVVPENSVSQDLEILMQYRMFASFAKNKGMISYRAEPAVIGFRKGYTDLNKAFVATDIIQNKNRVLVRKSDGLYSSPVEELELGVWETATERDTFHNNSQKQKWLDTFSIFEAAKNQGIKIKLITVAEQLKSNSLNLSKQSKLFIKSDLNAGYVVLVPAKKPHNQALNGWWRINKETGQTLGMTSDGRGSEMVEYLTGLTENLLGLANGLNSLKECETRSDIRERLCCLMNAHANNVGGGVFSGALGSVIGGGGATLFGITDFMVGEISEGSLSMVPKMKLMQCQ